MQKLLLATNNQAKVDELSQFFVNFPLELVTLNAVGIRDQAPEDGPTFEANARSKAEFYRDKCGLPALADDGGIEIDALGGEPGVDSHRWISKTKDDNDEDLITYTFERMRGLPRAKRGAQMRVVLALASLDKQIYITEGVVRGIVADSRSSLYTPGFPFRSVFYIPEIHKYYDHQLLTSDETMRYNHRRIAVEKMKEIILNHFIIKS